MNKSKTTQNTVYMLNGQEISSAKAISGLHLVATPVGNLADITLRALSVLAGCDCIYCEDTRISRRLLQHFSISTPLKTYHDHNGAKIRPEIIEAVKAGKAVALISDAGTPLISDPGYKLVAELRQLDLPVHMAPGVSAPIIALALSGLPGDRFQFCGFLPHKNAARNQALQMACNYPGTSIFFESAKRIMASLKALENIDSECEVAIGRELTKKFEEIISGNPSQLVSQLSQRQSIKGEITLVIRPAGKETKAVDEAMIDAALGEALQSKSAAKAALSVANEFGLKKRDLYAKAVTLAKEM